MILNPILPSTAKEMINTALSAIQSPLDCVDAYSEGVLEYPELTCRELFEVLNSGSSEGRWRQAAEPVLI